jgi:uncharacterized membrane protein
MAIQWSEILYALATFVVLTSYHTLWVHQVRNNPLKTYVGLARHLRHMWVESIMTHQRDVLAVQTLRNSIMASSLLASTGILIGLGLVSLIVRPEHISEVPFDLMSIVTRIKAIFLAKIMFLSLHFFFAFFSFTLSIRYLNQVSFMINVPMDCEPMLTPDFISRILDRGMLHYTMGMRAFYMSGVIVLWLFGPQWMLIGSLVLVAVLYRLDHCCVLDYSQAICELRPRPDKIAL